jgi:hypothetical protein
LSDAKEGNQRSGEGACKLINDGYKLILLEDGIFDFGE